MDIRTVLVTYNVKAVVFEEDLTNALEVAKWVGGELVYGVDGDGNGAPVLLFSSCGVNYHARPGDVIVQDEDGDFESYTQEDFHEEHDVVGWV